MEKLKIIQISTVEKIFDSISKTRTFPVWDVLNFASLRAKYIMKHI